MERPEPKFKAGQVVVTTTKKQILFRVLSVVWNDGWCYQWSRYNYASENMLRALTPQEVSGYMKTDKEFMDGIRRGVKDCKAGDKRLWSDVKKELKLKQNSDFTEK